MNRATSSSLAFVAIVAAAAIFMMIATMSAVDAKRLPAPNPFVIKSTISSLWKELDSQRITKTTEWKPPSSYIRIKGLYPSFIHFNAKGGPEVTSFRRKFKIFDNNGFVSTFVLFSLLQSHQLNQLKVQAEDIKPTIEAILSFRDKNHSPNPLYVFWPQKQAETKDNQTIWTEYATNLAELVNAEGEMETILEKILDFLHLNKVWQLLKSTILRMFSMFKKASVIPSDSDDTGTNLAIGPLLLATFPDLYNKYWEPSPSVHLEQLNATFQTVLQYAYRPFSVSTPDLQQIDTRSYYAFHDFILANSGNPEFALIPTWISSLSLDRKQDPFVAMPFHTNNLDISVQANFIFGALSQRLIPGTHSLYTPEFVQLLSSTISLIRWSIEKQLELSVTELALLYYPSKSDLYYFVGRLAQLIDTYPDMMPQDKEILGFPDNIRPLLTQTLANSRQEAANLVWWDEFLGTEDTNWLGEAAPTGDDRLFATSLALNTLLDAWTTENADHTRCYRHDIPDSVKNLVNGAANFLARYILTNDYVPMNAFFSGSVKSLTSLPFCFPGNHGEFLNGTTISSFKNPASISDSLAYSVKGAIEPAAYQKMLAEKWFGFSVPATGLNDLNAGPFPFWSSPSMTWAMAISGLSKHASATDCKKR